MIGDVNNEYDKVPLDQGSFGPKLGFLGMLEAGIRTQVQTNSLLSLEQSFRDAEQEQVRRARGAGVELKSLNDEEDGYFIKGGPIGGGRQYRGAAQLFTDGGDNPALQARIQQRDEAIARANEKNPDLGLKPYRDLFNGVKERAKKVEETYEKSPYSIGGAVGGFLGEAIGGLNPETDPLNVATLPIGGIGKSVVGRIATQAGGQGAIQALDEMLGVQENRRLLGLDYGFGKAVGNVAGAALGGAAIQGLGEGAAALAGRWFRKGTKAGDIAPPEPAVPPAEAPRTTVDVTQPEPRGAAEPYRSPATYEEFTDRFVSETPVLGNTRAARARTVLDMDNVARSLDDWHGPSPVDLRASVAAEPYPTRATFEPRQVGEPIDAVARRIDPDTFNIYDKLQRQVDEMRAAIRAADDTSSSANAGALRELDATIAEREAAATRARSEKVKARLADELETLRGQREQLARDQTPSTGELRQRLLDADIQMRDHAPLVARAYAQAKNEVGALADSDAARFLDDLARRNPEFRELPKTAQTMAQSASDAAAPPLARETTTDRVPLLANNPEIAGKAKGDAADKIAAVVSAQRKNVDDLGERFRQIYSSVMKDAEATRVKVEAGVDPNTVEIGGRRFHLDNDKIVVESLDSTGSREVSVRQYLDELRRDDEALSAVGTCSA